MNPSFSHVVQAHAARYPAMLPQDYVKLAYQSEFGPEHMVSDLTEALEGLATEARLGLPARAPWRTEDIGSGLCRYFLDQSCTDAFPLLARCFAATAHRHQGTSEGLQAKLDLLASLSIPGMADYLAQYRASGCPSLHHSDAYRTAYAPHYRVLSRDFVNYMVLLTALMPLVRSGHPAIIAIDGRCGSGKTGLAQLISDLFPCNVFHMDDFFLPFPLRTPERLSTPGGNVDDQRMREEVLTPLTHGKPVTLRSFDCHTGALRAPLEVPYRPLNLVEGSYAHHPALRDCYDLTVFLTCSQEEQRRRLLVREGEAGLEPFLTRWIPMEERYFEALHIEQDSDLSVDTTSFFAP